LKPDLLAETLRVWGVRSQRVLTLEDARQIVDNAAGFAGVLAAWAAAEEQRVDR
jgi:hypothetical protein